MRRTGVPTVVAGDGTLQQLSRLELSDRGITEGYLQESLHRFPQILPVEEIDPAFSPLVSLGREIASVDNLFISPAGSITLVETKLWRNPEATREVVAQVLDYATKLSSWCYSELEDAVRQALPPAPTQDASLYDLVTREHPTEVLPEEQFIDEVQRNLRTGRFLLLVVGDGIRENLENMLEHLHSQPQMLFTFGLVEVHIYENRALFDGRLLLPMLVAHTTEIVRAVVRVEATGPAQVSVAIEEEDDRAGSSRRKLSEDVFFEEIQDDRTKQLFARLLEFADEIDAVPTWRSAGVSIRLRDPNGSRQKLTLFVLTTSGYIYTGWLADQLEKVSLDRSIAIDYVKALAALVPGVAPRENYPDMLSPAIKARELEPRIDDFESLVRDTVHRIRGDDE